MPVTRRLSGVLLTTALITAGGLAGPLTQTTAAAADSGCAPMLNFSHRGAGGLAPENTAAAMALAAENGGDLFEVDLQVTADGAVVAMHDDDLTRTTDVGEVHPDKADQPVTAFTLAELEQLDAGSWWDDRFAGEPIPTMDQVLDHTGTGGDSPGVVLELKDPVEGTVEAIDAELDSDPRWADLIANDQVIFSSFDDQALQELRALQPDVPVLWVSSLPADEATLAAAAEWATYYGTHYRTLGAGDVDRIHDHGLKAVLYTLNSVDALEQAVDLGADAVFADYPNVLTAVCRGTDPFPQADGIQVLEVAADVPGDDLEPEVGEHVVLTNTSDATVDVSNYYLQDAVANRLVVGDGYTLAPGAELRIHTGPGTNSADAYYNDYGANVLNNNGDSIGVFSADHALLDTYAY